MWDVIYALDASSSMADPIKSAGYQTSKIHAVNEAIVGNLSSGAFPIGSKLGVVAFHAPTKAMGLMVDGSQPMVEETLPLTEVSGLKADSLRATLDSVRVGGATPSGAAITKSVEMLYAKDEGKAKRIKKLIMVTDERSNVGPRPQEVVTEQVAKRVIIDIVAIAKRINASTLDEICRRAGGKFTQLEGLDGLKEALSPGIPVRELGKDTEAIEQAKKLSTALAGMDKSSIQYKQELEKARTLRASLNKRLMQVLMLRDGARGEIQMLVDQLTSGPEGARLSMRQYADRVWKRASEQPQLETIERDLRAAMERLAV
jgi:von Willebrand factor type A domain